MTQIYSFQFKYNKFIFSNSHYAFPNELSQPLLRQQTQHRTTRHKSSWIPLSCLQHLDRFLCPQGKWKHNMDLVHCPFVFHRYFVLDSLLLWQLQVNSGYVRPMSSQKGNNLKLIIFWPKICEKHVDCFSFCNFYTLINILNLFRGK